jgi:UDP-hydrolysing UDP-N-acetyl-D-glucosamine 2-epimerase
MKRRRVCVVVTARPSYSRIRSALAAIRARADLELQLVVGASAILDRYGTILPTVREDGFPVAARVQMVLEGGDPPAMARTTGLGVLELTSVFDHLRPDVVVTIADRFETLATAIAAAYLNVPVAHVQGGEVTGSIDEKVRHAVTKLADLHLVASPRAAERVIRMGEDPGSVHVTGCPSIDLAAEVLCRPALDFDPIERYGGVGPRLDLARGFLVVLQHPVTTECELARRHVEETLYAVLALGRPTLWFWPNVDAGSDGTSGGIRAFRERERPDNIRFFKNMAPLDFLRLVHHADCLIGNSSVGIRECAFLGVPAVNVGTRQAGRDRGRNVRDVDYDRHAIGDAIEHHLGMGRYPTDPLYGDGHAGERIAGHLAAAELRIEKRLSY